MKYSFQFALTNKKKCNKSEREQQQQKPNTGKISSRDLKLFLLLLHPTLSNSQTI